MHIFPKDNIVIECGELIWSNTHNFYETLIHKDSFLFVQKIYFLVTIFLL